MPLPATPVQQSLHSTWVSCWLKAIWTRPPFKELSLSGCASHCSSFNFATVLEELRIKKTTLSSEVWSVLVLSEQCKVLEYSVSFSQLCICQESSKGGGCKASPKLHTCPVGWCSGDVRLFICADHPPVIITQMITSFCVMSSYTSVGALLSHSPKLWPWVYKAL